MKTQIIAASFLALVAAPLAARAEAPACGVPQGYGTSNPYTSNRSTCGFGGASYSGVQDTGAGRVSAKPQGYGTTNPFIPNSGAAHLGSNTATD
ncbi:MAG TPA: hypothetical protein VFA23_17095 [Dongiaceae bacterium]|nr:hypothetical protein [Dongiaceae bacterium]